MLLLACLMAVSAPTALAFCPYGCVCEDDQLRVACIKSSMEVMPISLNPSIRSLILKYNDFHTVDASFNFYPELEMVDLSHNKLISIPDRAFKAQKKLKELRLNNNEISEVTAATLAGLRKLESLDFSHNFMEVLPANAFLDLESLQQLDLSYNRFSQLEEESFIGLFRLRILKLDDNNLSEIPSALRYLPDLMELSMNRNKIKIVKDSSLPLPNLSILDLSSNSIEVMHHNSLAEAVDLKALKLHDNNLLTVPKEAFRPLTRLEDLTIGQNQFSIISAGWLDTLPKLRVLDISGCPELRKIEKNAFTANKDLESVSIFSNRLLDKIDSDAFSGLSKIVQLDISSNSLEHIPSSLVPWWKLRYLQVSGNPINCDCSNYFLKDVIFSLVNGSEGGAPEANIKVVRCWTPVPLRDQDLALLHLDCQVESSPQTVPVPTVATVGASLATVAALCFLILVFLLMVKLPAIKSIISRFSGHDYMMPPVTAKDILHYHGGGTSYRPHKGMDDFDQSSSCYLQVSGGGYSNGCDVMSAGSRLSRVGLMAHLAGDVNNSGAAATTPDADRSFQQSFIRHDEYFATLAAQHGGLGVPTTAAAAVDSSYSGGETSLEADEEDGDVADQVYHYAAVASNPYSTIEEDEKPAASADMIMMPQTPGSDYNQQHKVGSSDYYPELAFQMIQ